MPILCLRNLAFDRIAADELAVEVIVALLAVSEEAEMLVAFPRCLPLSFREVEGPSVLVS